MAQYHHKAARTKKQLQKMRDLEARGVCMFCPEHIHKEAKGTIEFESDNWIVKKNDFPYANTKLHLLIITKFHVSVIEELPRTAREEYMDVITKTAKRHKLESYAIGMRVGDMRYNGGSIEHLHAHLVVGDVDDLAHEPVRFKMSSRPE